MGSVFRSVMALVCVTVWSNGPAFGESPSVNAQMKILANQLGLNYEKSERNKKRISLGEFLEKLKPAMTSGQYQKFAKYVQPHRDKELPEVAIEANKLFLKESQDTLRLEVGRNQEALISVIGVPIPNADFEDVDAVLNKLEVLVLKDRQKNASFLEQLRVQLFPEANAWLWPLAIVAAAGLFGYFLYKGLSNMNANVKVSGETNHNVNVGGTVTTDSTFRFGLASPFSANIYSTGSTSSGAVR